MAAVVDGSTGAGGVWHSATATVIQRGVDTTEFTVQYDSRSSTRILFIGGANKGSTTDMNEGDVLQRLGQVERSLADIRSDVAGIKERLGHMPTKAWVLAGVITVLLAIGGAAWWIVQQLLAPLLAAVGNA